MQYGPYGSIKVRNESSRVQLLHVTVMNHQDSWTPIPDTKKRRTWSRFLPLLVFPFWQNWCPNDWKLVLFFRPSCNCRSSALRSTLNTNVSTALGMCKTCIEAVWPLEDEKTFWTIFGQNGAKFSRNACFEHFWWFFTSQIYAENLRVCMSVLRTLRMYELLPACTFVSHICQKASKWDRCLRPPPRNKTWPLKWKWGFSLETGLFFLGGIFYCFGGLRHGFFVWPCVTGRTAFF